MGDQWWSPKPQEKLSQGDVIDATIIASVSHPAQRVAKQAIPGGKIAWVVDPSSPEEHWISRGFVRAVLVLSHSCDLDKNERKARVIVAPVSPADQLTDPAVRAAVFAQQRKALMPLPDLPGRGDCYCDLRLIGMADRRFLDANTKLASLSDDALKRLHSQLVLFFTRE